MFIFQNAKLHPGKFGASAKFYGTSEEHKEQQKEVDAAIVKKLNDIFGVKEVNITREQAIAASAFIEGLSVDAQIKIQQKCATETIDRSLM